MSGCDGAWRRRASYRPSPLGTFPAATMAQECVPPQDSHMRTEPLDISRTAPETPLSSPGPCGVPARYPDVPSVPLTALDQLWFQVSGTICNLRCRHCFISCNPQNHAFWFLDRERVTTALAESVSLGVKEYYFTGGEPFMHRDMVPMLADALALRPATVLTNGTLLAPRVVEALARVAGASACSLEVRVSLDGLTEESNDAIRGAGAFRRALDGIARLVTAGLRPIVTAMQSWCDGQNDVVLAGFEALLRSAGYDRPRLKIMPPLYMGEEATRTRAYLPAERVTHEMLHGFDLDRLLCTRARLVTSRGIWSCPILLGAPAARLGDTLSEAAARPAQLAEPACWTCWRSGAICSNSTTACPPAPAPAPGV